MTAKTVDAIAQPTKQGFLFVFDRVTGQPLWPVEERPVPKSDVPGEEAWPTQPFPTKPPPFARQSFTENEMNPYISDDDRSKVHAWFGTYRNEGLFTPPSLRGTIEIPGNNGGANWGSSAVDPTKGTMFIVSKEVPMVIKLVPPTSAQKTVSTETGQFPAYNAPYDFMRMSNGLAPIGPPWSQLTAYDLNTGTIKWRVPNGSVTELAAQGHADTGAHMPRGGVVATAGGLLFVATASDRKVRAYDQDSGKVLWDKDLPAGSEGVPAVYEVSGREYVAICVAAGNGQAATRIAPDTAANKPPAPPAAGQYMVSAAQAMTSYDRIAGQSVERLAALSDGVFAVAMTLLVLDLRAPAMEAIHSERELWSALAGLAPRLLMYVMSFLTLGIFWVGQQTQLNHLKHCNRSLSWIHLVFLFAVSVTPFSTTLLAEFTAFRVALLVYWVNILMLGVTLYFSWICAAGGGLVKDDMPPDFSSAIKRRIVIGQSLYAFGALLSLFINTYWSIAFIVAVQLNYALALRRPGRGKA